MSGETGDSADEIGESSAEVIRFDAVEHSGGAVVLQVSGEVDTLTAPMLSERIATTLPSANLLVLDLSSVTFLGSAGLAALVAAKDEAQQQGRRLTLVCGSRIVTRALEATGLLGLFDTADGVPEALSPSA